MSVFSITINDPSPAFATKTAEVAFIKRVLEIAVQEIGAGNGTKTSGTLNGPSATGTPNTTLGSWTYTPAATLTG